MNIFGYVTDASCVAPLASYMSVHKGSAKRQGPSPRPLPGQKPTLRQQLRASPRAINCSGFFLRFKVDVLHHRRREFNPPADSTCATTCEENKAIPAPEAGGRLLPL